MNRLEQSYEILDKHRLDNGLYLAAFGEHYKRVWLRDSAYISMVFLDKDCDTYERAYHSILDIFRKYEWKIDYHTRVKPVHKHEFIHPRYTADTLEEINEEFGNIQFDSLGLVLFGIGEGIKRGKKIFRDEKDREIIQKLVYYLQCCEYWQAEDHGKWEELMEHHSTSTAAVIAGLQAIRDIVYVPPELIYNGYRVLGAKFPYESHMRPVDAGQLNMIYPFNLVFGKDAKQLLHRIESNLVRSKAVIRFHGDSYYTVPEYERQYHNLSLYYGRECEWTMFLPWLSKIYCDMGDVKKAEYYLKRTEDLMLDNGGLPELYLPNSDKHNDNSPLCWSNAKYIIAKESYDKLL